jgi:site-specific recombinase XerD
LRKTFLLIPHISPFLQKVTTRLSDSTGRTTVDELAPLRALDHEAMPAGHAAMTYLANLAPSGRRTTHSALARLGAIFLGRSQCDPRSVPWNLVRYEHAAAARAILLATYAPATVNKHLTALRGVSKECWRHGILDGDTLAKIADIPNVRGRRLPAGRMLSKEELSALWVAADASRPRDGACLALMFSAGLRRSEAAEVCLHHLDVQTDAAGNDTVWVRVMGKGGKERRVPVRGTAACRLRRHKETLRAMWARRGSHGPSPRLLGVSGGRSVAKMLEKLVAAAGIKHASCHDLRRSFVSHALAGGAPIADVARAAGHSDPRTTAGYDRRSDDALVGVADALPS